MQKQVNMSVGQRGVSRFLTVLMAAVMFLAYLLSAYSLFIIKASVGVLLGTILVLGASTIYLGARRVEDNFASLFVLYYWIVAFLCWPAIVCMTLGSFIDYGNAQLVYAIGLIALVVHLSISFAPFRSFGVSVIDRAKFAGVKHAPFFSLAVFGVQIMCMLIAYKFGFMQLGDRVIGSLPGGVEGVINLYRNVLFLFLVLFIVHVYICKGQRRVAAILILVSALVVLVHAVLKVSKGYLLVGLIPLFIYSFYVGFITVRGVLVFMLIGFCTLALFPFISALRYMLYSGSVQFGDLSMAFEGYHDMPDQVYKIMSRIFLDYNQLNQCLEFFSEKMWMNNLREVAAIGGPAQYNTFIVQGFGLNMLGRHSSGSSGLAGGYMVLGVVGMVCVVVFYSVLAKCIDIGFPRGVMTSPYAKTVACYLLVKCIMADVLVFVFSPQRFFPYAAAFGLYFLAAFWGQRRALRRG